LRAPLQRRHDVPGDEFSVARRRSRPSVRRNPATRLAPLGALAAVCVAAVVFGVLLEQVILAQSAFKLASIRRQTIAAEARNEALLLEVTKLQSPSRIERYARSALGMVEPARVEYVVAGVGSRAQRVARHPAPADGGGRAAAASAGE
jgi:cell division protein FtsL